METIIISGITVGLTPFLTEGVKKLSKYIPKWKARMPSWAIIATVVLLSILIPIISGMLTTYQGNMWLTPLLALSSVGLREIHKSFKENKDLKNFKENLSRVR